MAKCYFCGRELGIEGKISFREACPHCGMEVHVCRNCRLYAPQASKHCLEPQVELVRDAEVMNFCAYFELGGAAEDNGEAQAAKKRLEELFRKK